MLIPNVNLTNKTVLVTGAAGFIGANLVKELLKTTSPIKIVGIDNLNDYYDPKIKDYRLAEISSLAKEYPESEWVFIKGNIADRALIGEVKVEDAQYMYTEVPEGYVYPTDPNVPFFQNIFPENISFGYSVKTRPANRLCTEHYSPVQEEPTVPEQPGDEEIFGPENPILE